MLFSHEKVRITQFNANCWICGANATWIALKEQCFVKIGKYTSIQNFILEPAEICPLANLSKTFYYRKR